MWGQLKYKSGNKGHMGGRQQVVKGKVTYRAAEPDGDRGLETERAGEYGELTGYIPTFLDLCLGEFYGNWVHTNNSRHLSGQTVDNVSWKTWWRELAMMPQGTTINQGERWVGALRGH